MHLLLGAINCLSFCRLLKWHSLACTSVVLASSFSLYLSSCISHMVAHYKVGNSINSGASTKKEKKTNLIAFHTSCNIHQNHTHTSTVVQSMPRIPELNRTKLLRSNNHALMRTLLSHTERENFTIIETVNAILILNWMRFCIWWTKTFFRCFKDEIGIFGITNILEAEVCKLQMLQQ